MAEITDSIKQTDSQKDNPAPNTVRDALLRLRQLAANLPTIDAAAVVREIRENRITHELMPVILDANLLVALVSGDPRGDLVSQSLLSWIDQGIDLHAPELAKYEVANALTRLVIGNAFPADRVEDAWNDLLILPITYHALTNVARVIEISLKLKRQSAYDSAYLALAENLNAELYTLDGPLYRNAIGQGFKVRLLQ